MFDRVKTITCFVNEEEVIVYKEGDIMWKL